MLNKIFLIINGSVLVLIVGLALYPIITKKTTAYINVDIVYNNFKLKDELEKNLQKTEKEREKILDSLEYSLQLLSKNIETEKAKNLTTINEFEVRRESYLKKQREFEESTQAQMEEYKTQIWKQLRQYMKEYGDTHGYSYIYGIDDQYYFIYANDSDNITDEVKVYVNNRYSGAAK